MPECQFYIAPHSSREEWLEVKIACGQVKAMKLLFEQEGLGGSGDVRGSVELIRATFCVNQDASLRRDECPPFASLLELGLASPFTLRR